MAFNNKLYSLRKKVGLSQEELGDKLNVSRQTISKWELGETTPELEKLIAISDFFDVSLDELVMGIKEHEKIDINDENKFKELIKSIDRKKILKVLRIILTIFVVIFIIDIVSMIVYFILYGLPK